MQALSAKTALAGARVATRTTGATRAARSSVAVQASSRPLFFPGAVAPSYLDGSMAADYGFDPLGLGADPKALTWHRQAELVHCRWAMLAVAGILGQEVLKPEVFWYNAGLPENLPDLEFGGKVNLGGILAWEFLLMHFVEVRRWQDIRKFGSVNSDPIFSGRAVSNPQMGYPGFDPLGLSKGDFKSLQTKELKNGRLAMVAFMGFTLQAQATGKGPLACLSEHLSNPFGNNITANIGHCMIPSSVDVQGVTIPLVCLWPGQQ